MLDQELPRTRAAEVLGRQLLRAATSVGANYRAACRSRSTADLLNKLGIVDAEADETGYWLQMLVEARLVSAERASPLLQEADEILRMTVASIKTVRQRSVSRKRRPSWTGTVAIEADAQSKIQNPKSPKSNLRIVFKL